MGFGNKINRVNVSLTNEENVKLNRLSVACNMKPTTMAHTLLDFCLNNPDIIHYMQNKYNVNDNYKLVLIQDYRDGKLDY